MPNTTDPTTLSPLDPYKGLGLFRTIDTPEQTNLLNADLRAIADRLTLLEAFNVREVTNTYTTLPTDDVVVGTGTFTVNLHSAANALELINIKCVSGTVTVDGAGSELIDGSPTVVLTNGQAVTLSPITGGWVIV